MAYLTVRTKGEDGHSYQDLVGDRIVLGRAEDCDVRIQHPSLSRHHCVFVREAGSWFVEDQGSSNGTIVNRERLATRSELGERDRIKIGKIRLTMHLGERSERQRRRHDEGIAVEGQAVIERQRGVNDPPEAMPCPHCETWMSIAHHLAGDHMDCPACGKEVVVVQLCA